MKNLSFTLLLFIYLSHNCFAQQEKTLIKKNDFQIGNNRIQLNIEFRDGELFAEKIADIENKTADTINTDGDFALEIVWTDWSAPGMDNNAENPLTLTKKDFEFVNSTASTLVNGAKQVQVYFKGKTQHLQLLLTYLIEADHCYLKRKIAVRDDLYDKHFLHQFKPFAARMLYPKTFKILKAGGFGQPVAFQYDKKGFFYGLEYPAASNTIVADRDNAYRLSCSKYIGNKISSEWLESDWVVFGLTPNAYVKKWFFDYVNDIKVAPNKPYLLYNTWYDLRGEDYPLGNYVKVLHPEDYMNQKNILRLYQLLKKNLIDKYNVELNAIVLDDGWDVYASDWQLRQDAFPGGLTPIISEFSKKNIQLGIWFGPIGGYSARGRRIGWYKQNGYELIDYEKERGKSQLCLAGKNYAKLFKDRTTEFVKQGVAYYKWDGIQFSCSETGHGHPTGLYSLNAVLDTLTAAIQSDHQINPNVYHNVTSGTWLSPWWLKYADQIWMQGEDYGYAEVPSYNESDAAMTYRDLVLFDDFHKKDFWFPIGNMMTHGIIKAKLEVVCVNETLDKFTDNVILYFSRGVSMYELYTSPDIMTADEWQVIAQSLKWAKKSFAVLMNTAMIGGDPEKKQAYGYLHLKGNKGIIAARNPFIEKQQLVITLSPEFGLNQSAKNLVLEKVYPFRWLAPEIYKAGDSISLPLAGYETAIYEIYPLAESMEPLISGVPFNSKSDNRGNWEIQYYESNSAPVLLNKNMIKRITCNNNKISLDNLPITQNKENYKITDARILRKDNKIEIEFAVSDTQVNSSVVFFLKSIDGQKSNLPMIDFLLDGEIVQPKFNGFLVDKDFKMPAQQSGCYSLEIKAGKHHLTLNMKDMWKGDMDIWSIAYEANEATTLKVAAKKNAETRIIPPQIIPPGNMKVNRKIGILKLD